MKARGRTTLWETVGKVSEACSIAASIAVVFIMVLTVLDVIGRSVGRPIMGTYEVIALTGAVVVGFSMPLTTATGSHVYMEFLINRLPKLVAVAMNVLTRIVCTVLFAVIGANVYLFAGELATAREVSTTLKIPIYPFAYLFGTCCFLHCLVFLAAIVQIFLTKGDQR
jgi:TRAP-type transport system small permease protein